METVKNLEDGWYILQDVHDKNWACIRTEVILRKWVPRYQNGKD